MAIQRLTMVVVAQKMRRCARQIRTLLQKLRLIFWCWHIIAPMDDGSNKRNWLYVADHCSAVDMIIHHGKNGEIYNIGGREDMSNIDTVKLILSILGKDNSLIRFTADRKGHDRRYCIDSSKIRNELGWKPTVAFDDGIRQTVDWYKENRKWWNGII